MFNFFANNPESLDTEREIRDAIREAGGDPMDTRQQEQTVFAWSLMHDTPRDSPRLNAAETELVADAAAHEHGLDITGWDWPDIENAPAWYDDDWR